MSLIVIEGVDASGKSTLLEQARIQIPQRYFVQIRHSCRPLELSDALHFMRLAHYGAGILDVIADRHPLISEPIYGPILRGGHLFEGHFNYIEEASRIDTLKDTVDRIIYCRPPDDIIEQNLGKNSQLSGVREKIWNLLDAYNLLMTKLQDRGIPVIWYNWPSYTGTLENLFFGEPR